MDQALKQFGQSEVVLHLFLFLQFDVASLVPLELFYFKTGINPLLRLPRLLKVLYGSVTVRLRGCSFGPELKI